MFNAPHAPIDADKLSAMIEALRIGEILPPIVVVGEQAICGSHRIAAAEQALCLWENETEFWENSPKPTLDYIEVGDVEVDFDELDYNVICRYVYERTSNNDAKKALEDQR